MTHARLRLPHALVGSVCAGIALANLARLPALPAFTVAAAVGVAATLSRDRSWVLGALALLVAGWWWGSVRLDRLDRSVLAPRLGTAERALVETLAPARGGRFDVRVPARVLRFGTLRAREPALLELPPGRAPPPQGARLEILAELVPPRGPSHGFDERTWLRRHGMHVVLRADRWRIVGRRGGIGGVADSLHRALGASIARGLHGERRAVLEGVVLGEDEGLSDNLRDRFRASGLYHLLAVSGTNVAFVAGGGWALAWLLGLPRWLGEVAALAGIGGYVLAVGPQPSVLRAAVAGALGAAAWLLARQRDRWYALLLGAFGLLAWNPYLLLDAGFQLSFAAVIAIFTVVRPLVRALEGYPLHPKLREAIAISTACGVATAPVSWLQFHRIPLLTVPANALAAPVVLPMLWLALAAAVAAPVAPFLASLLASLNGWCAAYLAGCARLVGGLPGAQVTSPRAAAAVLAGALLAAAYAWQRGVRAESGLPPHRQRPPEDRARARAAPPALRPERGRGARGAGDARR